MRTSILRVAVLVALCAALAACGGDGGPAPVATSTAALQSPTPALTVAVPDEFRALADELRATLEAARAAYAAQPDAAAPVLAAELLPANGNRGEDLLLPSTLTVTSLYLDALQRLGARGVNVQIVYPLLADGYPRRDEYLAFFRAVAASVRQRGMQLFVETGAPFSGTEFSTLRVDYAGKTPQQYLDERLAQARTVAHELRPDYLTLAEEQDTERRLTGLDLTYDAYAAYLRSARDVIDPPPGVRLGAGSGTWERPELVEMIVAEPSLDFLDIHVYPLTNGVTDYLSVAAAWAKAARAAGKEAAIGEAWLYKVSVEELRAGLGFSETFARDPLSFWAPLDALFIETMSELARASGAGYVSFFWSRYLFGYVDAAAAAALTPAELIRASNAAAFEALSAGLSSESGEAFRRAAAP